MRLRKYLVCRADGDVRIVSRPPNSMRLDEFAYRLNITIPDTWASILGDIDIEMPEPAVQPTVTIDEHHP